MSRRKKTDPEPAHAVDDVTNTNTVPLATLRAVSRPGRPLSPRDLGIRATFGWAKYPALVPGWACGATEQTRGPGAVPRPPARARASPMFATTTCTTTTFHFRE